MAATSPTIGEYQASPNKVIGAANGVNYAYRDVREGTPALVLLQHFRGNLDNWDPALIDALVPARRVVTFDNAGVGGSTGTTPDTIEQMARDAIAFMDALDLGRIDVLGFSIGGFVAQEITLQAPDLVRRLILLGTGPRNGEGMHGGTPEGNRIFAATYEEPDSLWLSVFFTPSKASQAAGREFLKRFRLRSKDRDPEVNAKVPLAQRAAIAKWAAPREHPYDYLKSLRQPTLVVNGSTDLVIYTVNSFILQQNLPNAQLIIYPDSAHGGHHQYPELFVRHASMFLSAPTVGVGAPKSW